MFLTHLRFLLERMIFRIVLSTLAAAASIADSMPYLTPRSSIVIVNDSVGFNCNSTNATRLDWFFIRNVSLNDSQYFTACVPGQTSSTCAEISSYGDIKTNFTNVVKLLVNTRNGTKESYLSIQRASLQYAGAYVCSGGFNKMSYSFLNVIDPLPICNEWSYNNATDKINIVCYFNYYGVTANLHWSNGVGNMTNNCSREHGKISCAISINHVDENSCNLPQCNIENQSLELINGNMSFICIFGTNQTMTISLDAYSHVFYLETRPVASIRCFKIEDTTTSGITTSGPRTSYAGEKSHNTTPASSSPMTTIIIALAVSSLVILIIILALVLLLKRGGRKKSAPEMTRVDDALTHQTDPTYSTADEFTDGGSAPVYGQVKKTKVEKSAPVYGEVKKKGGKKAKDNDPVNDICVYDNTTYADVVPPQHVPKRPPATSKTKENSSNQDFDGNNVVYAELGREPPKFRIMENRSAPASDGQFDRSEYAAIDHVFNAPPPPAQTNPNQRRK